MPELSPIQELNRREFHEYKLATSLPEVLLIYGHPRMYAAQEPVDRPSTLNFDSHKWAMERIWFTTPIRIHGLLHMEAPAQIFFMGYKCSNCNRIFLVPDIKDINELSDQMRHACHV